MVYCNGVYFAKSASNGFLGDFKIFSMIFIEGMCIVALTPTTIMIKGSTFHSLLVIFYISSWYISIFVVTIFGENLSLQYGNSMKCV